MRSCCGSGRPVRAESYQCTRNTGRPDRASAEESRTRGATSRACAAVSNVSGRGRQEVQAPTDRTQWRQTMEQPKDEEVTGDRARTDAPGPVDHGRDGGMATRENAPDIVRGSDSDKSSG